MKQRIPHKEQRKHYDYQYDQTERQEELLLKREMKRLEREKLDAYCREQEYKTDKDRECEEVYRMLERVAKGGAE